MVAKENPLERFLRPGSIALFGSMQENWYFGAGVIVGDLLKWGFAGPLYPVHPSAASVYGIPVLRDLKDTERVPDLAIVVTSCRNVPAILEQCGQRGIKAVVIVSDGFGESGPEGARRQEDMTHLARSFGMRIIGPNTVGIFNAWDRITTIPYDRGYDYTDRGGLSIITQTGMYGPQAMAWHEYPPGINKVIDLGNMCDIDETDCLDYLADDEGTAVISIYMEHTKRPDAFRRAARQAAQKKPVLCLKPGGSPGAATAMASHTGSLAGDQDLYRGMFRQAGIIRVEEYEDLRDYATPFLRYPLPGGNRLGVITFSGAIGIQCIEAAEAASLRLGQLSPESRRKLGRLNHTLGGHPVDVGPSSATAGAEIFNLYRQCFDILAADANIDCLYFNAYVSHGLQPAYYEELLRHIGSYRKKPITSWCYGSSRDLVWEFGALAERCGIPFYPTSRKAIRALSYTTVYAGWRAAQAKSNGE